MVEQTEHVLIGACWHNRKMTARAFIAACYGFLSELRIVSPVFANRCVAVRDGFVIVPDDYAGFERVLIECMNDPEYAYINPGGSDPSFTLDSTLPQGFVVSFSDPDDEATDESAISIRVRAGSYGSPLATANTLIELPPAQVGLVKDTEIARQLLNVMVQVWKPEFASIYSREVIRILDPLRKKRPCGAWMYFADATAATVIHEPAVVEYDAAGGVVVRVPASLPWATHVDLIQPCCENLEKGGFLDHPST